MCLHGTRSLHQRVSKGFCRDYSAERRWIGLMKCRRSSGEKRSRDGRRRAAASGMRFRLGEVATHLLQGPAKFTLQHQLYFANHLDYIVMAIGDGATPGSFGQPHWCNPCMDPGRTSQWELSVALRLPWGRIPTQPLMRLERESEGAQFRYPGRQVDK